MIFRSKKAIENELAEALRALHGLVTAHNGYQHGMGPCICAAHEEARRVLGITRADESSRRAQPEGKEGKHVG